MKREDRKAGIMFKLFFWKYTKPKKVSLPSPYMEHKIVFKKGAVEAIKRVKGWKTDVEMAQALGLTRAYISMLRLGKVGVTATVITRLAVALGNVNGNWWEHFQIIPWGVSDPNHPIYNQEKYMGRIPYSQYSQSVELRKKDYKAEIKKF